MGSLRLVQKHLSLATGLQPSETGTQGLPRTKHRPKTPGFAFLFSDR